MDYSEHTPAEWGGIDKIAAALAAAQGAFEGASMSAVVETPGGKKRPYATLSDVIAAVRQPLSANGLAIVQLVAVSDDSRSVVVTTQLLHASGQSLMSITPFPVRPAYKATEIDAQAVGSAITYARRYALSALLCIATEHDDDAQAAVPSAPPPRARATPERAAAPPAPRQALDNDAPITATQISAITNLSTRRGVAVPNFAGMTHQGAAELIQSLNQAQKE